MTVSRPACTLSAAAVALASLFGATPHAAAETLPVAVIAVIDIQFLLRESAAGKDVRNQIETIRAKYQAEITRREAALRAEEEEFRRQQTILSPETLAARRREFQDKVVATRRYVQDTNQMLDQSYAQALREVQNAIFAILGELRAEYAFNLVLDKSQIFFRFETLDLSQQVLDRLDQRLPTVAVHLPVRE